MNKVFLLITLFVIGCTQQPKSIHDLESEKNRNKPIVNLS